MSKLLIFVTITTTVLLLVGGIYYPDNPMIWLASTSQDFAIIRSIIIVALIGLLFTNPPRKVVFRSALGVLSLALVMITTIQVNNYSIYVLDAFTFLQAAIIFALAAIEPDPLAEDEALTASDLLQRSQSLTVTLFTAQAHKLLHAKN